MTSRYDDDQFDPQDDGKVAVPGFNPDCKYCGGSGVVYDTVDWWGASVSMLSACDCESDEDESGDVGPEPEMTGAEKVEDAP